MHRELEKLRNFVRSLSMDKLIEFVQTNYDIKDWADMDKEELVESVLAVEMNNYFK